MSTSLDALNAETLSLHLISAFRIVKLFACWEILNAFCRLLIFFKINFLKNSFRNIIRVSNTLDPDQARQNVGPDLGPNCLQRLSADDMLNSCWLSFLGGLVVTVSIETRFAFHILIFRDENSSFLIKLISFFFHCMLLFISLSHSVIC